jgi:very-short-patch-repair endonuclease
MKRIDKDEFIRRSKIHHDDNYDYSLVNYKNNRTKVVIVCKKHGNFEQVPESHMNGFGCNKCSNNYNLTNEEFIDKLKMIFGNKINYDKIEYKSQNHKVTINCSKHGDSLKFPQSLLRGSGCNKCEIKNFKIDASLFTERANVVHNFKYDYSSLEYVNDRTKVKIICKKHGLFLQTPNTHLSGSGCPICSGRYNYTNSEFIEKSKKIHYDKYEYPNCNYKNAHTKVKILCKKHGVFTQNPSCHLQGQGCPSCKESKGEIFINEYLVKREIKFIRQKTFNKCKNKSLLYFDFYLPELNLCIEYDGEFHYKPIFGIKYLEETTKRDIIKNNYCEKNNIRLLRIPYTEFNKIPEILENELFQNVR